MSSRATRPGPAGFVLLSVLLLTALVVGLSMTYARSAMLAGDSAPASRGRMVVQTVMDSGVVYARQSLLSPQALGPLEGPTGDTLTVQVAPVGDALRSVAIHTEGGGRSGQISALAEVHMAAGGALPTLTEAARAAVLASPGLITVTSSTTYTDTTIDGILLVSAGRRLTLQNVVLNGAIIGSAAMSDAVVADDGVDIDLDRSVIIRPGATLPGCAIVAPASEVSFEDGARVQIEGVVVARELDVEDSSSKARLHGQLVVADADGMHAGIVQLGAGRGPRSWPGSLKSGSQGITRLVFNARRASEAERNAIRDFDVGAWRALEDVGGELGEAGAIGGGG